jgi:7-keto-8-aminopelargonate synthetase-like enzyme
MLIEKVSCPKGCHDSILTSKTKVIDVEPQNNLLLEGGKNVIEAARKAITSYTCQCCGTMFEIVKPSDNKKILL